MRKLLVSAVLAFASVSVFTLPAVTCTSCSSPMVVQEQTLLPAMRLAVHGIVIDANRGILAKLAAHTITEPDAAALRYLVAQLPTWLAAPANVTAMRTGWPAIRHAAEAGIDAQVTSAEIGDGVAVSLRERLVQFHTGVDALRE